MSSAMLDYEKFDLGLEMEEKYSLEDAMARMNELRSRNPDFFVRINSSDGENFTVESIAAKEVYAEWMERFRNRLNRINRRTFAR